MGILSRLSVLAKSVGRRDGWENSYTGVGTTSDKTSYTRFCANYRLDDPTLSALYNNDAIAGRIVSKAPREMLRKGYRLQSKEDVAPLLEEAKRLRLNEAFLRLMIWGRLYGGCLMIIGADDSRTMDQPLVEEAVRGVRYLNLIDRRYISTVRYYQDPLAPDYGKPEIYEIAAPNTAGLVRIHASRVVRWDGEEADYMTERELNGWSFSVLQRPWDTMRAFQDAFQSVRHLLADASQGVFKLDGLIAAISSEGGAEAMQGRMRLVEMSRSVARSVLLDAESESFERVATSFTGLPDVLDRFMQLLSAATEMPVTMLMGRSAAGMNATGDGEARNWYDTVSTDQRNDLGPRMLRVYRLIARGVGIDPKTIEIHFSPLWQLTETEAAEVRLKTSQADTIDVAAGVLLPEEVALSRFTPHGFCTETTVNRDLREKALAAITEFSPTADAQEAVEVAAKAALMPPEKKAAE